MAVVTGNEYDHITISDGTDQTVHYLKDAKARENLINKADKTDTVLDTTLSMGRKANTTSGTNSVALGKDVEASGTDSHAEGWNTTASGNYSHSEGAYTTASGLMAHSEGGYTTASGLSSHAEGVGTISNHSSQHVFGEYNVADPSENGASVRGTYVEIVGNGNDDNTRSNARTLDWSGNEALSGDLTINKNGANEMTVGQELSDLKSAIGNTTMGTTATTVTGAIAEHESDIEGINTALAGKQATLTFDSTPTANSTNPVTSGGVKTALDGKQDTLTFDNTPTSGSNNPVKSGGIYNAIEAKYSGDIATAVDDWLDDHPEATTTVQDFSLTVNKLVKGTLGYVMPQQFGAKGDGETDDAQAIKDAIDYALANNVSVYIPAGTYIISPNVITINFIGNDSLTIYGDGKQTCIRRKANSLTENWQRLFIVNNANATADSGSFIFRDLYIDSNRRNQENATLDYTYQGCADLIMYFSNATYSIDTVLLNNLWFYDGVADHIGVTSDGVVHARNIIINNVIATGRVGKMNDIDFPGIPMGKVFITNVACQIIHVEYNSTPTTNQYFYLNNIHTDELSVGGILQTLEATNVHVFKYFNGASTFGQYTNCIFDLKQDVNLFFQTNYVPMIRFTNCIFNHYDAATPTYNGDSKKNACTYIAFRPQYDVVFNGCTFNYKGAEETTATGYPILFEPSGNTTYIRKAVINNCKIDKKFSYAFSFYSCGNVTVSNMVIENPCAFLLAGTNGISDVTITNVQLKEGVAGHSFHIEYIDSNAFTLNGDLICSADNMGVDKYHVKATNIIGNFKRTVMITSPLTKTLAQQLLGSYSGGYVGTLNSDTFVYVGENRELYPEKWISKQTSEYHPSNITADKFLTYGSGYGTTVNRPTCFLSQGFEYYDTDLAKMIMWDGSAWKNLDGTALS